MEECGHDTLLALHPQDEQVNVINYCPGGYWDFCTPKRIKRSKEKGIIIHTDMDDRINGRVYDPPKTIKE